MISAPKVNSMVQDHLLEYGQLNYDVFINAFIKIIVSQRVWPVAHFIEVFASFFYFYQAAELCDNIPDFIESCLPFLKSSWSEIRGNAAVIIGK